MTEQTDTDFCFGFLFIILDKTVQVKYNSVYYHTEGYYGKRTLQKREKTARQYPFSSSFRRHHAVFRYINMKMIIIILLI